MPHRRKTKDTPPDPGHEACSHTYRYVNMGLNPRGDQNPRRQMTFRAFCLVHNRWMSVNVSYGWFWEGTHEFGTPSAQYGEIEQKPAEVKPEDRYAARVAQEQERIRQLEDTDRGGR